MFMLYKLKKKKKKDDWQILLSHNQTQVSVTGPNFHTGYMFFLSGECVRMKHSP